MSFLLLLMSFLLLLSGCMTFKISDQTIQKKLKLTPIDYTIEQSNYAGKSLRYIFQKNENAHAPILIFVHGAPGSLKGFMSYLKDTVLTNHYSVLIVDRLGYGSSGYGEYADIKMQVESIKGLVLNLKTDVPIFLIGHSFGGPIVAHAAISLKDKINGTIMLAPAIDPEHEKYFWFGKLGLWKSTRWMTSKALQVAATEKYGHADDLKTVSANLKELTSPILHIHGTGDGIVPFVNTNYTQKMFDEKLLEISVWKGSGHLIPFKEQPKLVKEMIEFIEKNR